MAIQKTTLLGLCVGTLVGAVFTATTLLAVDPGTDAGDGQNQKKEPLYWVAPMDPNYRRDAPGKSPMGMDLIPVYEEGGEGADASPGTVRISPEVVNNLGVRTSAAKRGQLNPEIDTVGYLEANQDELVHINPRIEGWIEKLHVNTAGDRVEKGQPLYALYSPELVNAQQEFLQSLRQGDPRFIKAAEDRLIAWQVPDSFIAALRKDRQVQQTVTYNAPQGGYVAALNARPGEFVQPGQVLMSLAKLNDIWLEAEVFANQAHLVEAGLPATMTLDYLPGKVWQGKVEYVYPTLNPETRTLPVRLTFSNEDGALKPNMFARVVIHGEGGADTVLVPKEAVIRTGEMNRVVLAQGEGRFKSVQVQLGPSDDEYFEIIEGVHPGERVVTSAQFLIDSESSKTSDFARMIGGGDGEGHSMDTGEAEGMPGMNMGTDSAGGQPKLVKATATINAIAPAEHKVNLTHAAIPEWDWPVMKMDFSVAEGVDLASFAPGDEVTATIEKQGDAYLVTALTPVESTDVPHAHMNHEASHPATEANP